MIARYSRAEMAQLWQAESRFSFMLKVEIAVAQAQAELGLIPKAAATAIARRGKFSVQNILKLEETYKHDVIAFVKDVSAKIGKYGRFLHYGMTSSDILDTASSLQIRQALDLIVTDLDELLQELRARVKRHKQDLCAGRTHGMHAEPTTLGYKFAGHLAEFARAKAEVLRAQALISVGKISGAVGTYSTQSPQVEVKVCRALRLQSETVATQVIPRDRHLAVMHALAVVGCAMERLAIELRHLQRTEVGEVTEGFSKGQRGSSAMPHKKNPISAENLTGIARLLRSYVQAAYENVALWHERDISHSSVERVIWPDSFIVCDYALSRLSQLVRGLEASPKRMRENLEASRGQIFSSHLLVRLVDKGLSRDAAYDLVQELSHQLGPEQHLREQALQDERVRNHLSSAEIEAIFSGQTHLRAIVKATERALKEIR